MVVSDFRERTKSPFAFIILAVSNEVSKSPTAKATHEAEVAILNGDVAVGYD